MFDESTGRLMTMQTWRTILTAVVALAIILLGGTFAWAQEGPEAAAPVAQQHLIQVTSLMDMIMAGGPMLVPILLCSTVLLVFVFERAVSLRRRRVIPKPFVKRFLHQLRERQLDRESALELCQENNSPVAAVFEGAVRKWGRPGVEVEQAYLDAGERAANGLRRYLRVINGVATVSPLLGLLGTVWGMIQAFNEIATASAMGRPELLAGGIAQALLTTAAGLVVAIPALICYLFFVGRVDRLVMDIDEIGQRLVRLISAEGLEAKSRRSSKKAA
jgi:biopolymer transport protein ExbB